MIKLTKTGKIVLGTLLVLFCGLIYILFFRGEAPPPTDPQGVPLQQSAPVPQGYKFPLSREDSERWSTAAIPTRNKLTYCSFFTEKVGGDYESNRQTPLDFVAIVAPEARQSPYYYQDPKKKREYYPVFPIGAGSKGLKDALAAASEDAESADPCIVGAEGSPVPVVVAFPPGEAPPAGGLVRIKGYMALQYGYLSDNVPDVTAPIVNAGEVKPASLQQALSPANYQRVLNLSLRRGPVVMRLSRVEFSSQQTRVWAEIWNTSPKPLEAWQGVSAATIQERGAPAVKPAGLQEAPAGADQLGDLEVSDDLLQQTEIPAASGTPGKVSGYIIFPYVNPKKPIELSIPDPYTGGAPVQGNNITIKLLPQFNQPV